MVSYSTLKHYQKRRGTCTDATMNKSKRTTDKQDCKKNGYKVYGLAKKVERNSRFFNELKIYTDYQWGDPISGQDGIMKIMGTRNWYAWGLGTLVLSVGLFLFIVELVFLRPCLFRRLVSNFSFSAVLPRKRKSERTSPRVRVGIRTGFRVCGRVGVLVSGFFFCSYLFASVLCACRPAFGCLPACLGCLPACLGCQPALLAWGAGRENVSTTHRTICNGHSTTSTWCSCFTISDLA